MSKGPTARPLEERFWEKVDRKAPGECWEWQGAVVNVRGCLRGRFFVKWTERGSRSEWAYRVAYELAKGPILDGVTIRHCCDNPLCCNPRHLLAGTQGENVKDMHERGRARVRSGAAAPGAKLTETQVREVLDLQAKGISHRAIATRLGVSKTTIGSILTGKKWKAVTNGFA